jgi:hypothetical protein
MMRLKFPGNGMLTQAASKPCMTASIAYREHMKREVPE